MWEKADRWDEFLEKRIDYGRWLFLEPAELIKRSVKPGGLVGIENLFRRADPVLGIGLLSISKAPGRLRIIISRCFSREENGGPNAFRQRFVVIPQIGEQETEPSVVRPHGRFHFYQTLVFVGRIFEFFLPKQRVHEMNSGSERIEVCKVSIFKRFCSFIEFSLFKVDAAAEIERLDGGSG